MLQFCFLKTYQKSVSVQMHFNHKFYLLFDFENLHLIHLKLFDNSWTILDELRLFYDSLFERAFSVSREALY